MRAFVIGKILSLKPQLWAIKLTRLSFFLWIRFCLPVLSQQWWFFVVIFLPRGLQDAEGVMSIWAQWVPTKGGRFKFNEQILMSCEFYFDCSAAVIQPREIVGLWNGTKFNQDLITSLASRLYFFFVYLGWDLVFAPRMYWRDAN